MSVAAALCSRQWASVQQKKIHMRSVRPNPSLNLSRYGMPRLAASASLWHFACAASRVMPPLSG
jgi:hypothetical protein